MSDAATTIRGLLKQLDAAGKAKEASALRLAFDLLGWERLTEEDVVRVRGCLPLVPNRSFAVGWSPVDTFAPWVRAIPNGVRLVDALNSLANAHDLQEVIAAARSIFVDCLGYTPDSLDITARLTSTGTIARLLRVAEFRGFTVTVAQLVHPRFYDRSLVPLFQLHPHGFAIEWYPLREHLRFTFRDSKDERILSRTFVGPTRTDPASENLVTWAGRLAALAPGPNDAKHDLASRASAMLTRPIGSVMAKLPTVPIAEAELPSGLPWHALVGYVSDAFYRSDSSEQSWHWGLGRAFRERFPIKLGDRPRIIFRGYTLDVRATEEPQAHGEGRATSRRVNVQLELDDDEKRVPFRIECSMPAFGAALELTLDGNRYRYVPRASERGNLFVPTGPDVPLLEDEELLELQNAAAEEHENAKEFQPTTDASADAGDEAEPSEVPEEFDELDGIETTDIATGADPCAMLLVAVRRKLNALVRRLWKNRCSDESDLHWLGGAVAALRGPDGIFSLVSSIWLKSVLEPIRSRGTPEDALQVIRARAASESGLLPSWACPDVSAELPAGVWVPVANARLTPGGDLAVPLQSHEGVRRLSTTEGDAFTANPRCGGGARGSFRGWTAPSASQFEALPAGRIDRAASLAASARPLRVVGRPSHTLRAVSRSSGAPRVQVFAASVPPPRNHMVVKARFPAVTSHDLRPDLRVQIGSRVLPGDVWVDFPGAAWAIGKPPHKAGPSRRLLQRVFLDGGEDAAERPLERWRVPPDVCGTVVLATVSPNHRLGQVVGWTATITVAPDYRQRPAWAWLPGGQAVQLEWSGVEEAPFDEDGRPYDALVEGISLAPRGDGVIFDPESGELWEDAFVSPLDLLASPETAAPMWPNAHIAYRLRDGEGIPSPGSVLGLTAAERLWWRARAPEGAALLDAEEVKTGGGEPPFWAHLRTIMAAVLPATRADGEAMWMLRRKAGHSSDLDAEASDDEEVDHTEAPRRRQSVWMRGRLLGAKRTVPSGWQTSYEDNDPAPRTSTCACGETRGHRTLGEYCHAKSCAYQVSQRPSDPQVDAWPYIRLPEPILHPWSMTAAAAILGMFPEELTGLMAEAGPSTTRARINDALARACGDPYRQLAQRLRAFVGKRQARVRLARASVQLADWLRQFPVETWWMDSIPILPPALHPTGLPERSADLVESPIRAAYAAVNLATERLSDFLLVRGRSSILLETARRQVIDAAAALYGDPEAGTTSGEPRSLADLIVRLWPTTRARGLRTQAPGLFAAAGKPCDPESPGAVAVFPTAHLPAAAPETVDVTTEAPADPPPSFVRPSPEISLGVATSQGVAWFPPLPIPRSAVSSPSFWRERAAMARLWREGLVHLAAVLAVVTKREGTTRPPLNSRDGLARLCAAAEHASAAPSGLVAILAGRLPYPLPTSDSEALARVEGVVARAFPGEQAQEGRRLLTIALSGWWQVEPSIQDPTGWQFCLPDDRPPAGATRAVPPWSSTAWHTWPAFAEFTAPALPLMWNGGAEPTDPMLRALCGFDVEPIATPTIVHAERIETATAAADDSPGPGRDVLIVATPELEAPPSAESAASADLEIRVLRTSIAAWSQGFRQ